VSSGKYVRASEARACMWVLTLCMRTLSEGTEERGEAGVRELREVR
jgi:hypothetical protein